MTEQDVEDASDAGDEAESVDADESPDGETADSSPEETDDVAEETPDAAEEAPDLDADADEELVERVAESDPEAIAREIAGLRTRVDGLEAELDEKESEVEELTSKLKRKQADFQNYKKRMEARREEERERITGELVTSMLDVRDNLVRALDQDEGTDIRGGVESTLRQFDDILESEDVEVVDPEPGEDVDPHRHEVLVRVESDQPEGTIADVHRPGYVMGENVLREAQVTVSEGSGE